MLKTLLKYLRALVGESLARILAGGGMGLATFGGLTVIVNAALSAIQSAFGGFSGEMASIVGISGLAFALNACGSAMVTVVGMKSVGVALRQTGSTQS